MKVKRRDLYTGTTAELIEYFERKYPLKSNRTFPRKEGEFYCYDADDKNTIRSQIEIASIQLAASSSAARLIRR